MHRCSMCKDDESRAVRVGLLSRADGSTENSLDLIKVFPCSEREEESTKAVQKVMEP